MKKILLTGSTGFIGRNIFNSFLFKKYKIFMPRHSELDITKPILDYVVKNEIDYILHAAVSPGNRNSPVQDVFDINTKMTNNIVGCSGLVEKILFFSSGSTYGLNTKKVKESEDFNSPIGVSSRGLAKLYEDFFCRPGHNMYSMRLFGVYGPYEDYTIRFISNMICKALHRIPMTMNQDRMFDYIWIQDLMAVIDLFIENNPEDHIMNITPDKSESLYRIALEIRRLAGCPEDVPVVPKIEGMGLEYSGDNSLFKENFPDFTFTTLESGIKQLVAFYQNIIPIIDKKKLMEDI
jgi:UDP-glucose 4-epimerase